jgi:hypothetical protein
MKGADASERPSEAEWDAFAARAHRSLVTHRLLSVAAVVVILAVGGFGGRAILESTRSDGDAIDIVDSPTESETVIVPGPTGTPGPDPTDPSPTEEVATTVVQQWFVHGDEQGVPQIVLTYAEIPAVEGIARATLEKLFEGVPPDLPEIGTGINPDTEILGLTIEDGTARLDLSEDFQNSNLGSTADGIQIAQITATLLQFDTVKRVLFLVEGEVPEYFFGHGIVLDGPQDLQDIDGRLPAIVVESPYPEETVDETFTVTGTANVFEANVSYRILDGDGFEVEYRALDADGNEVDPGFTTATSGSGTRGTYSFTVELIQETDFVMIEVFQASAEDGRPMDVVQVPVRVRP